MATVAEHQRALLDSMEGEGPHKIGATFEAPTFAELANFSKAVLRGIDKGESKGNGFVSLARSIDPIHAVILSARTECMEVWSKKISQTILASMTDSSKREFARDVRNNFLQATESLYGKLTEAWKATNSPEMSAFVMEAMIRNLGVVAKIKPEDKSQYLNDIIDTLYPKNMTPAIKKKSDQAIEKMFVQQAFGKFSEQPFRDDGFLLLDYLEKIEIRSPGISASIDTAIAVSANNRVSPDSPSDKVSIVQLSDNIKIKSWTEVKGGIIGRNPFEGPAVVREQNGVAVNSSFFWKGELLGSHKGPPPVSDKVMSNVIENMQEAHPEAFKKCLEEFVASMSERHIDIQSLQPSLRELVEEMPQWKANNL